VCKAAAWRIMLAPQYPVPVARLFRYTISAFAASVIAPARAGEILRSVAAVGRAEQALGFVAATALADAGGPGCWVGYSLGGRLALELMVPGSLVMERKMLRGLRERAERLASERTAEVEPV